MMRALQKFLANYLLQRQIKKRKRSVRTWNLEKATKIGILFSVSEESTYLSTKRYIDQLKQSGVKEVLGLGYILTKEWPSYLKPNLEFDFFTKKEVSWLFRPNSQVVTNFVNNQYDILIDLSTSNNEVLRQVLAISDASLKVGRKVASKEQFYDIMIETPNGDDLEYLIKQIDHYLSIIDKPTADVE